LTLTKVYWLESEETAAFIRKQSGKGPKDSGQLFAHIEEWNAGEPYAQYRVFLHDASHEFVLKAEGHPDVSARVAGTSSNPPDVHELNLQIPAKEYANMAAGVEYELTPVNGKATRLWKTSRRLVIKKPGTVLGLR
jgi:hypothetical protein